MKMEKTLYDVFAAEDGHPAIVPADSRPRVTELIDTITQGIMVLHTLEGLPVTPEMADERARNIVSNLLAIDWINDGANGS